VVPENHVGNLWQCVFPCNDEQGTRRSRVASEVPRRFMRSHRIIAKSLQFPP
jgi:hypothetical protein